MEDWIVITGLSGSSEAEGRTVATERSSFQLKSQPEAEPALPASKETQPKAENAGSVLHKREAEGTDADTDAQTYNLSDVFRSVTDLQRAGRGLYDSYYDSVQGKLLEFRDVAATRSRWALERAKAETQQVLSTLAETQEVETDTTESYAGSGTRVEQTARLPEKGGLSGSRKLDTSSLEEKLGTSLIPQLASSDVPVYDGTSFDSWYAKAEFVFDRQLPKLSRTCELFVRGVKLYSVPSVAVVIDDLDFTGCSTWNDASKMLSVYFEQRHIRMQKYRRLLTANAPSRAR